MTNERLEEIKHWCTKRGYATTGLPEYSEIWQLADENQKLREETSQLREALELIADGVKEHDRAFSYSELQEIAHAALEEK